MALTPAPDVDAHIILCDAAQADPMGGKVHMLGAGWSRMPSPTTPHAVVVLLKIPWHRANEKLPMALELRTADGPPVELKTADGNAQVGVRTEIEVGRPPGLPHGSTLDASFALNVGALPLVPGRYEWHLTLADREFGASFTVSA